MELVRQPDVHLRREAGRYFGSNRRHDPDGVSRSFRWIAGTVTAQPSPHTRSAEQDTNFFAAAAGQQFDLTRSWRKTCTWPSNRSSTPGTMATGRRGGRRLLPGAAPQGSVGRKEPSRATSTPRPATFSVALTTHFQGTYSVNGGPPLLIPGQGQFEKARRPRRSASGSPSPGTTPDGLRNAQGEAYPTASPRPHHKHPHHKARATYSVPHDGTVSTGVIALEKPPVRACSDGFERVFEKVMTEIMVGYSPARCPMAYGEL